MASVCRTVHNRACLYTTFVVEKDSSDEQYVGSAKLVSRDRPLRSKLLNKATVSPSTISINLTHTHTNNYNYVHSLLCFSHTDMSRACTDRLERYTLLVTMKTKAAEGSKIIH